MAKSSSLALSLQTSRRIMLVSILFLSACGGPEPATDDVKVAATAAAEPEPDPPFRFGSLQVGSPVADAKRSNVVTDCFKYETGKDSPSGMSCKLTNIEVVGSYWSSTSVSFPKGRFRRLELRGSPYNYEDTLNHLTSSYGEPCRQERRMKQNAFGPRFEDEIAAWCFAEGILQLEKYTWGDTSTLMFGVYGPSQPASPTTHTPDNL